MKYKLNPDYQRDITEGNEQEFDSLEELISYYKKCIFFRAKSIKLALLKGEPSYTNLESTEFSLDNLIV